MFLLLTDERDAVQKKTFTKWVNSHLSRVSCRISDLYNDLRDGYMLTRLLEVLSGELLVRKHTHKHTHTCQSTGIHFKYIEKQLFFLVELHICLFVFRSSFIFTVYDFQFIHHCPDLIYIDICSICKHFIFCQLEHNIS